MKLHKQCSEFFFFCSCSFGYEMFKKLVVPLIFTNLEFLFFMNNKGRGVGGVALKKRGMVCSLWGKVL